MFSVTFDLFGDEVWMGHFSTYDMALFFIEKRAKFEYYENGLNDICFTVWYDGQLYQEVVYSI